MATFALQPVTATGPVARLDVRVKFTILLLASTVIFVWNSLLLQSLLLAAVVALGLAAGVGIRAMVRLLVRLVPALVLITVIQGLWSPFGTTPVFIVPDGVPVLGGVTLFFVEGLLFGLVVCCRILVPLLAFEIVFLTTDPNTIVLGLVRLGVPYKVAFLVSSTFRFVPLLLEEFQSIKDAQRLRGVDIAEFGLVRKMTAMGRMLVPLIMLCLNKALEMEIALQAKGFSGSAQRTYLNPGRARLTLVERVAIVALFAGLVAAIVARLGFGVGAQVV